jgi:hypothetical protein
MMRAPRAPSQGRLAAAVGLYRAGMDADNRYEKLAITDSDGLTLVVFHAEPGSPSAQALERLALV